MTYNRHLLKKVVEKSSSERLCPRGNKSLKLEMCKTNEIDTDHTHQRCYSGMRGSLGFADSQGWSLPGWAQREAPRAQVLPHQGQGVVATATDVAHSTMRSLLPRSRLPESRRLLSPAAVAAAAATRVLACARHSADRSVIFIIRRQLC